MNAQSYLSNMKSKLDRGYTTSELAQAIETLYQFDHLNRENYEIWMAEIKEIEAKKTEQLLKVLAA
ncbi:hypothetical protein [Acinetobacter dispersus]|uniref:hypothetical protein n=1 Tax=Acinetobacter dispersus TaxID=70348 RepID=UPI001F4B42C2|nr:hypothetical protein [Acinetobacter dispersus]MCH7390276.1 hypothetical protein [Acinetobacter dispersus]